MMTKISRDDHRPIRGFRPALLGDLGSRWAFASICFVTLWSVLELFWEFDARSNYEEIAALLLSKIILFGLAALALRGRTGARHVFLVVCLLSVIAIVWEIPREYGHSHNFALLSGIECLGKSIALISLLFVCIRQKNKAMIANP